MESNPIFTATPSCSLHKELQLVAILQASEGMENSAREVHLSLVCTESSLLWELGQWPQSSLACLPRSVHASPFG